MKYKIGDKVRVRKDLIPGNEYDGVLYISYMDEFKGKECIISNIDDDGCYQINHVEYLWSDEMLESVNDLLLDYALEKLGMTKEELEYERKYNLEDKENIEKAKEMARLNHDMIAYCNSFEGACHECKVKEFKTKYSRFGSMICSDVFNYLREKGEV